MDNHFIFLWMSYALEKYCLLPRKTTLLFICETSRQWTSCRSHGTIAMGMPYYIDAYCSDVELIPCRVKGIYVEEILYRRYATDIGLLSSKNTLEPQPTHVPYL